MSKLSAVIAGISLASFASNPVQTVETAILNLIKSTDTNYAALEPELDGAVNGIVPLITKILKVYAFAKVEASLKEFLVYLGGKYPNIAPELNIIIAKL